MKDFIKKNKFKLIFATIILFILTLFIPLAINIMLTTPSPFGFVTSDTFGDWVNFYAAIIGTYFTVIFFYFSSLYESYKETKANDDKINELTNAEERKKQELEEKIAKETKEREAHEEEFKQTLQAFKDMAEELKNQNEVLRAQLKESKIQFEDTNKKHDQERREDLAIQYKPILSLEFSNSIISNIPSKNSSVLLMFDLKNDGRGEALNIEVKTPLKVLPYVFASSCPNNSIIEMNKQIGLMINFLKIKKMISENKGEVLALDSNDKPSFPLTIEFNDAFGNAYLYQYTINVDYVYTIAPTSVKSIALKDNQTFLEPKQDKQLSIDDISWKAHVSKPIITYTPKQID